MSSNIQVLRICQNCGKEFLAKTTVTKFCNNICSSQFNKSKIRAAKIEASNKESKGIKAQPIEELKAKEFLTVTQVSKLIGCSRQNVYKLINSGKLRATNILEKKTLVKRAELEKLFEKSTVAPQSENTKVEYEMADCYSTEQVRDKFNISVSGLRDLIIKNNIPKFRKGWYAYVPKVIIDKILG